MNLETTENTTFKSTTSATSVAEQVAADLLQFLGSDKDRSKRISILSRKTGIHTKTLHRLLNLENKPSYTTVFKIYKIILGVHSDAAVLENVPTLIKDYLKKAHPQKLSTDQTISIELNQYVRMNPIALEMIVLSGTGEITKSDIVNRYGQHGLQCLSMLVDLNALCEYKPSTFKMGTVHLEMTPDIVIRMGQRMIQSFAKPENGDVILKHYHGFFAEGLSEAAYKQWIKIDEEAYLKKVRLAQLPENLGSIRAYTLNSTDTLETKETDYED